MTETQEPYQLDVDPKMIEELTEQYEAHLATIENAIPITAEHARWLVEQVRRYQSEVKDAYAVIDRMDSTISKLSNALALTLEYLEDKAPLGVTYREMVETARAALREAS